MSGVGPGFGEGGVGWGRGGSEAAQVLTLSAGRWEAVGRVRVRQGRRLCRRRGGSGGGAIFASGETFEVPVVAGSGLQAEGEVRAAFLVCVAGGELVPGTV